MFYNIFIFVKLWVSFVMGSWILKGNWRFGQVWLKFPKFFENSLQKSLLSLPNCQAQSWGLLDIINISLPLPFPVRPDTNFGYKVWKNDWSEKWQFGYKEHFSTHPFVWEVKCRVKGEPNWKLCKNNFLYYLQRLELCYLPAI